MPELSPECTASPAPPPVPPGAPPIPPERGPMDPAPPPGQADEPPLGDDGPSAFAWEDDAVFRFTFLRYFTQPGVAAALQALGVLAYHMVLESWGDWPPGADESLMVSELRAAAADLRFLQAFLADQSEARNVSGLEPFEERLSRRADGWARQAGRIAASIEEALPPLPEVPS